MKSIALVKIYSISEVGSVGNLIDENQDRHSIKTDSVQRVESTNEN